MNADGEGEEVWRERLVNALWKFKPQDTSNDAIIKRINALRNCEALMEKGLDIGMDIFRRLMK